MPVKVTTSLSLRTLLPDIKRSFLSANNGNAIEGAIISEISQGRSPVFGKQFKQYSTEYAKIKGGRKPVDMNLSGDMLKSLEVKPKGNSFIVRFKSKIAKFHNETGRVIRRLLPSKNGERFKKSIEKEIFKALELASKKATDKQNRS